MNSASVSYIHNQGMGFNPLVEIESYTISDNLLVFGSLTMEPEQPLSIILFFPITEAL